VTLGEKIGSAAFRYCWRLDDEGKIIRDVANIFLDLSNNDLPPAEWAAFSDITALALLGRIDASEYIRLAFVVLNCNGLLELSRFTAEERSYFADLEKQMENVREGESQEGVIGQSQNCPMA
jgi:hypothetical protein